MPEPSMEMTETPVEVQVHDESPYVDEVLQSEEEQTFPEDVLENLCLEPLSEDVEETPLVDCKEEVHQVEAPVRTT